MYDWAEVLEEGTSDGKAQAYQDTLLKAMDRFFPFKTVRRKSTNPPWMDKKTLGMIEDRRRLYVEEGGRSELWKEEKKRTREAVKKRKRDYFDKQKDRLLVEDANRNFYRHVKNLGTAERPRQFDVRDLMPEDYSDQDTAEALADYFNRVSNEFDPLGPGDIPCTIAQSVRICLSYMSMKCQPG